MTNKDLDLAREWAKKYQRHHVIGSENELAAVEVIQSLPDTVVDGDKLRKIYDLYNSGEINLHEAFRAAVELAIPPRMTLAELVEAGSYPPHYQWMQADHTEIGRICITQIEPTGQTIINQNGAAAWSALGERKNITPRPDLPRLEWPDDDAGPKCEHCRMEPETT